MVDASELANYAEIFGFLTVLGGLGFAGWQIRQARRDREDQASITLLSGYVQRPDTMAAIRQLSTLPEDWMERPEICGHPDTQAALDQMQVLLELTGMLVYRRSLRLHDAAILSGNMVMGLWPKIKPWAYYVREEIGRDGPFEWAEWLYDRFAESDIVKSEGAFTRFADWKP